MIDGLYLDIAGADLQTRLEQNIGQSRSRRSPGWSNTSRSLVTRASTKPGTTTSRPSCARTCAAMPGAGWRGLAQSR